MNGDALYLSYQMQRGDFEALNRKLASRGVWRPILILAAFYLMVF